MRFATSVAVLLGLVVDGCAIVETDPDGEDGTTGTGGRETPATGGMEAGGEASVGGVSAGANGNQAGSVEDGGGRHQAGSTGTGGSGNEAGSVGAGGSSNEAGSLGCGGVTEAGTCDGTELVVCQDDTLTRIDCAQVGALCRLGPDGAECADLSRATMACGTLTELGTCEEGELLRYCDTTGLVESAQTINCAAYGRLCDPTAASDGGAACVSHGPCGEVDENGTCAGNELRFCEEGELFVFDCGVDECRVVGGFADCFLPGVTDGCGTETAGGRCDGNVHVSCLGGVVTREECDTLGLECQSAAESAGCERGTACPAACPGGTSCDGGLCVPESAASRAWTVMVYMVGDNNLSDAAYLDLAEMEAVGSTDDVQIVSQVEFSQVFSLLTPSEYRADTYRVAIAADGDDTAVGSLADAESLGDVDMADPATLEGFLRWAVETYPAQRTALVFWDHGEGYKGGFFDSTADRTMSIRDMIDGVREAGVHLDLLAFDACLMGMHEIAYGFRGFANVMVASEETVPGTGFPYESILTNLTASPGMTAMELGAQVVQDYTDHYSVGLRARSVTMATLDLGKAKALNEELASFARTVGDDLASHRAAVQSALRADTTLRFTDPDSADVLGALASFGVIEGDIGTAANDLASFIGTEGIIMTSQATGIVEAATGLALYLPENAFSAYTTGTFEDYRSRTSFLPLEPWHALVARLTNDTDTGGAPVSGDAADTFSLVLSWASEPDGVESEADLDLYVYEPNGDFATPPNGTTSTNGMLSADSYDSGVPRESYDLKADHQSGRYIVLVHFYSGPEGEQAYPRLQVIQPDLTGGSRTLLRGKVEEHELLEYPMDSSVPLVTTIDEGNVQQVYDLDFSDIWWAVNIEVR
ncbi:MAG: hypothetical protein JW751_18340 [Polyangiaceae bacterium]|nr:hypothetical protein [Polyangiaceae bacterium]